MSIFDHLAETEAQRLWVNGMAWEGFITDDGDYVEKQQGRFETTNDGDDPTEKRWQDAYATWHTTTADALLYLAYVRNTGAEAVLLYDTAALDAEDGYPGDVVVTLGYEPDKQWLDHTRKHPEALDTDTDTDADASVPPEGMWSGWTFDAEHGIWVTRLQNDYDGALGWHARVVVEPMADGEFGLDAHVLYVTEHVHGADVLDQPHSVHQGFNQLIGVDPSIGDDAAQLAHVQRFGTSWAAICMETFDVVARSSQKIIERRTPALMETTVRRLHEVFDDDAEDGGA